MDRLKYYLGIYGEKLGLELIVLVTLWDILVMGARGFFQYSVGWKGVILVWIGVALIHFGKKYEENNW